MPTRWDTSRPGIDRAKQADFLRRGHIDSKYDCHTCWARPLCAGGCHHEAFVRYGDTGPSQSALLRLDSRLDRHLSSKFMARSPPRIPDFCSSLPKGKQSMRHMRPLNQESRAHRRLRRRPAPRTWSALQDPPRQPSAAPARSDGLRADVHAGLGSGFGGRHGRAVPAGGARYLRLLRQLLLAGAGSRSSEQCAGLDRQMRHAPPRTGEISIWCFHKSNSHVEDYLLAALIAISLALRARARCICRLIRRRFSCLTRARRRLSIAFRLRPARRCRIRLSRGSQEDLRHHHRPQRHRGDRRRDAQSDSITSC